ncbi:MAG: Capsular polysaccharide biosynthesis protein [candidate division WS6 bacterium GW2011_GWF2_39_15]|uniref:Capsular polysaccharide biosynthesis protein n=1 Tax=candidate division WS6 bacterium GW2011_GWF2_39_15 TaxID=1619100 RepID=A0A0G0MZD4_9BACT|nr:MAG: Capsular polysaccharide biosynthesis protein [candidate division WS6 bacterium GW2011_GWF2_39_15]
MSKEKKYLSDIIVTLLFGGLISFLGYLFNVYLARNLTSNDFSLYTAAVGIIYLVQVPAITIQAYITQQIAENRNFNLNKFIQKSLLIFSAIGLILALALVITAPFIAKELEINTGNVYVLSFVLFASVISPISKGILFGIQKILEVNMVMLGETILKFLLGLAAIWLVKDVNVAIVANGIPLLLSGLLILPFIKFKQKEEKLIALDYKHLGGVFLSFFLINTPYTLDLLLVNHTFRAEYSALSLLGKIVYFACIMIASTMFSQISNAKEVTEKRKVLWKTIGIVAFIGITLSGIFYLFDSEIVEIVFKGKYSEISQYVGIYGLGMTIYAICYLITNFLVNIRRKYSNVFLSLVPVMQIYLFSVSNESVKDVVWNQLTLFIFLTSVLIVFLSFRRRKTDIL